MISAAARPRAAAARRPWLLLIALTGWLVAGPAAALSILRIGTSGDYAPFSHVGGQPSAWPQGLSGFDIAVVSAYARDRGSAIEWVHFTWPELLEGLRDRRYDLAIGGVTVRPDRSVAGVFTVPLARTGLVLLLKPRPRTGARSAQPAAAHLRRQCRRPSGARGAATAAAGYHPGDRGQ